MGSTDSKQEDPLKKLAPPKPGEIDISDKSKLVKLEVKPLDVPKPPPIKMKHDRRLA